MDELIKKYKKLKSVIVNTKLPKTFFPTPTQSNYDEGVITRYFVQLRDTIGSPIFEVDRDVFYKFNNSPFYKGVKINWRISGNLEDSYTTNGALIPSVVNSNKRSIVEAEKILPEINLYLVNLKQFYRGS
jgi:hypothetical protein